MSNEIIITRDFVEFHKENGFGKTCDKYGYEYIIALLEKYPIVFKDTYVFDDELGDISQFNHETFPSKINRSLENKLKEFYLFLKNSKNNLNLNDINNILSGENFDEDFVIMLLNGFPEKSFNYILDSIILKCNSLYTCFLFKYLPRGRDIIYDLFKKIIKESDYIDYKYIMGRFCYLNEDYDKHLYLIDKCKNDDDLITIMKTTIFHSHEFIEKAINKINKKCMIVDLMEIYRNCIIPNGILKLAIEKLDLDDIPSLFENLSFYEEEIVLFAIEKSSSVNIPDLLKNLQYRISYKVIEYALKCYEYDSFFLFKKIVENEIEDKAIKLFIDYSDKMRIIDLIKLINQHYHNSTPSEIYEYAIKKCDEHYIIDLIDNIYCEMDEEFICLIINNCNKHHMVLLFDKIKTLNNEHKKMILLKSSDIDAWRIFKKFNILDKSRYFHLCFYKTTKTIFKK